MAPKLPPPANTKAVFAGPAWSDTDKVLFAPAVDALTKSHATFGCIYSSGKRGCAINIGCAMKRPDMPRMLRSAPHLRRGALLTRGPFLFNCGWVPAPRRTAEEALHRVR